MFRLCIALVAILTLASSAFCFQLDEVKIETFDGQTLLGQLDSITEQGELAGENIPVGLNVKDLLAIENLRPVSTPQRSVRILLPGQGSVLASEFTSDGQNATVISKTVVGDFALESMKAVIWRDHRKVETALKNRSAEFDQVVVDTGEDQVIVSGLLERVTEEKVELNYEGESRKISRSIVLAIVTADLKPDPPSMTMGTFEMVDGSKIEGGIASYADGVISVMLDRRNPIQLDASFIKNLTVKSDRIAFLSSMTPIEVDQRAYFGVERPWQADKNTKGSTLTLNSSKSDKPLVFRRGIGTQSYSRLSFDVPEGFDRFTSIVGIDAGTQGKGDCQVVVQADGIEVWQGRVKAADDPQLIDVDISDAQQISLIVQPGKQYDLSDHLNWCDAKFLNTK